MGTDIHIVAQTQGDDGVWRDLEIIAGFSLEARNYTWFTFLDGTRGSITNDRRELPIIPIAKPRGKPDGFAISEPRSWDDCDTYHGEKWMGYGVTSWVLFSEIIEGEKMQPKPIWLLHPEVRVGPIDELERLFLGRDPEKCRLVFGYDS